jgi:hypothetical protein
MRIDPLPFLVVLLIVVLIVGGALVGLYQLFNRLIRWIEKHDQ